MSKFSRNKNPQGSSSSDKSSPIELIELEKENRNKWQLAYSTHMKQNGNGNINSQNSAIITPRIANITSTVVKYKLQGELRGMLFNSKKINSGLGYSIAILIANIIFIMFGTFVFVYIEGKAETKERLGDYEAKVHLMNHINNSKNILPQNKTRHEYIAELYEELLELQINMCEKGNSKAGEKMWQYTGSLHYCLTILSTIGYGVTAPHNNLSKALSVIYALLGIPVYAVYLSYAYLAISTALNALSQLIFTCIRRNPGEVVRLLTKLFLANFILWSYLLILVFLWTPIQKKPIKHPDVHRGTSSSKEQKSVVDELYWQVIRFTSIGFGDEFRDVSEQPAHIPEVINIFTVGFILLPFGISITSFFFQMYRKLFGKQRKWIDVKCRKIQKRTLTRVRTIRLKNGGGRLRESPPTRSSNTCGDSNLIPITETDALS